MAQPIHFEQSIERHSAAVQLQLSTLKDVNKKKKAKKNAIDANTVGLIASLLSEVIKHKGKGKKGNIRASQGACSYGKTTPFQFVSIGAMLMNAMQEISSLISTITNKLIHGVAYKIAETDSTILNGVKQGTKAVMTYYQKKIEASTAIINGDGSEDQKKTASQTANLDSTNSSLAKSKREAETANPETNLNTDMQAISSNAQYASQQTSMIGKMSSLFDYVSNLLSH